MAAFAASSRRGSGDRGMVCKEAGGKERMPLRVLCSLQQGTPTDPQVVMPRAQLRPRQAGLRSMTVAAVL
jgi:hypothetical protein